MKIFKIKIFKFVLIVGLCVIESLENLRSIVIKL